MTPYEFAHAGTHSNWKLRQMLRELILFLIFTAVVIAITLLFLHALPGKVELVMFYAVLVSLCLSRIFKSTVAYLNKRYVRQREEHFIRELTWLRNHDDEYYDECVDGLLSRQAKIVEIKDKYSSLLAEETALRCEINGIFAGMSVTHLIAKQNAVSNKT